MVPDVMEAGQNLFQLTGSRARAWVCSVIRSVENTAAMAVSVAVAYTTDGPRENAYRKPPTDGPRMVAAWKMLAFHATALGKCSPGTNWGRSARLTGALKARTTPTSTTTA